MRAAILILGLGLGLAGCAGPAPVPAQANRADGIVTMSSDGSLFQPVAPDWAGADTLVGKRCRGWGYRGEHIFAGDHLRCLAWDRNGRCVRSRTERFYRCEG